MDYLSWKLYGAQYKWHPSWSVIFQGQLNNRITIMIPDNDIFDLDPKLYFSQINTFIFVINRMIYFNVLYLYFAKFWKSLCMLSTHIFGRGQLFVQPSTGFQLTPLIYYSTNFLCPQCCSVSVGHFIVCLTSIYAFSLLLWYLQTFVYLEFCFFVYIYIFSISLFSNSYRKNISFKNSKSELATTVSKFLCFMALEK